VFVATHRTSISDPHHNVSVPTAPECSAKTGSTFG
jgi:diketogulonate reductase-like aldo/keto reductase